MLLNLLDHPIIPQARPTLECGDYELLLVFLESGWEGEGTQKKQKKHLSVSPQNAPCSNVAHDFVGVKTNINLSGESDVSSMICTRTKLTDATLWLLHGRVLRLCTFVGGAQQIV